MKKFSVIIPSWKNIALLDLVYKGLRLNSAIEHEIIVFFNEYDDKAKQWAADKAVIYDFSPVNLGVCAAVNRAAKLATTDYICYMNDDMYPLPGWDMSLQPYLELSDKIWISSTPVEPGKANPCAIGFCNYGTTPQTFREDDLLRDYRKLKRPYNVFSTWTPSVIPKSNWDAIGGFDEHYFPGHGSDPDLAMKMYAYGCMLFIGVGTSLVYHFARQTVSRYDGQKPNDSKAYFRKKWGMSRCKFLNNMLYRGEVITPELLKKISRKHSLERIDCNRSV
ncbi:MAG: glycosyltransferase [Verrucomicrobiota bacterium]